MVAAGNDLTFAGFAAANKTVNVDYLDIVNNGFYNEATAANSGYYKYYGSIVGIYEVNYGASFSAIGYLGYFANGEWHYEYTSYSEENNARSIQQVARKMLDADVITEQPTEESPYLIKSALASENIYQGDASTWATQNPRYSKYTEEERAYVVEILSHG